MGYAVGGADLCAAGVGAPHIRQRIYWMAVSGGFGGSAGLSRSNQGQEGNANFADNSGGSQRSFSDIWGGGGAGFTDGLRPPAGTGKTHRA
jgi:hypothetical protein